MPHSQPASERWAGDGRSRATPRGELPAFRLASPAVNGPSPDWKLLRVGSQGRLTAGRPQGLCRALGGRLPAPKLRADETRRAAPSAHAFGRSDTPALGAGRATCPAPALLTRSSQGRTGYSTRTLEANRPPRRCSISARAVAWCGAWRPVWGRCCTTWERWACSAGLTSSCWAAGCCWPRATRCCAPPSDASPTRAGKTPWPPRDCCLHRRSWARWTGAASWASCTARTCMRLRLTLLLEWAEQFEAESGRSDEAVAFSVLLGDLNFDNHSQDHAREQEHKLFSRFRDPCRLGTRREQPWALGTLLSTTALHHSVASSPEMLCRALEQEKGRQLYLAGPPSGGCRPNPWQGRRLDYIVYRAQPGGLLSPEVEQVTFSTALAGLTDHLAVGLHLRVSAPP
ncbi:uncharacterized protein [Oryctolagus cuniculus]|uniref:uncharacterized protein isoform X5 n=1 Tax=Oryctolagus cuniculus TaxID=9986 RepID=UPI00387936FE